MYTTGRIAWRNMQSPAIDQYPAITVVIAAYNAEKFIERAITSALHQTIPVRQVLVVDDASTDRTVDVVARVANSQNNVELIRLSKNGGPSVARNVALDSSKGDWIAILDADDAFLPDRLQRIFDSVRGLDADIIADAFRCYHPISETIDPSQFGDEDSKADRIGLELFLERARPLSNEPDWGLLKPVFRTDFLNRTNIRYPTKSRHGEDFLLIFEAFLRGARFYRIRYPGYLYTARDSGFSRTPINYSLMWEHSEALLQDPRVSGQAAVALGLRTRTDALRRLAAIRDISFQWHNRDILAIASRILRDCYARAIIRERIGDRLRSLFARG